MTSTLRHVLGPGGLCAAAFPGYESRPGQLAMAERIRKPRNRAEEPALVFRFPN